MVRKLVPLYIADNFSALEAYVQNDDQVRRLKKTHRLPNIANTARKLKAQFLLCQEDQEQCYILGKRYICLMEQIFENAEDKSYFRSLFVHDYVVVKNMVANVEEELKDRYLAAAAIKPLEIMNPGIQSVLDFDKPSSQNPVHKGLFIQPSDLIRFMNGALNLLILDIRPREHFELCRIHPPLGYSLNIPNSTVCKGMTAHSLQQVLPEAYHDVWDQRENFDIIVIMDNNTTQYFYPGSSLEIVRNFIVEWDFNKKYKQAPVILDGGLKAVIDCYPTKVFNPNEFIVESDTNNEIDELLDLDEIAYPEPGTTAKSEPPIVPPGEPIDEDDVELPEVPANRIRKMTKKQMQAFDDLSLDVTKHKVGDAKTIADIAQLRTFVEEEREKLLTRARATKSKVVDKDKEENKDKEETENLSEFYDAAKKLQEEKKALLNKARATKPKRGPGRPPSRRGSASAHPKVEGRNGTGFVGMGNERNCCYMNAMLQCLKVLPVIKLTYVSTNNFLKLTTRQPPLLNYHFAVLMRDLWNGTEKSPFVLNHKYFRDQVGFLNPMYTQGQHEDTFEFLMFIFNTLHDDCQYTIERPKVTSESQNAWHRHWQGSTSFLIDAFYYQLRKTQICIKCKIPNYIFEIENTLMLPIPSKASHLDKLLDDYMKQSIMKEYSCKDCKCLETIADIKDIVVAPEVLIIVLKRGIHTKDGTKKCETKIDFTLQNLEFANCVYDLYAILHHNGSLSHGHYYASVLVDKSDDIWLSCNDDRVSRFTHPVKELPHIFRSCMGFFYVKQNVNHA